MSDGACPPGARLVGGACACRADLRLVLGACVSPRTAADRCGSTAIPTVDGSSGGCVARAPCAAGRARDVVSGLCLPRRDVRALASSVGILVAEDEVLACPSGAELVAVADDPRGRAPRLACLPAGEEAPTRTCAAGAIDTAGACVRVAGHGRVDVARWVHAVIGVEGGEGAPLLCAAIARSPGAVGAAPADERVSVALVFPDNDVTQVSAEVHGTSVDAEPVVAPLIEALRALGGVASQASVATTVRCTAGRTSKTGASATVRPAAVPENPHEE